MQADATSNEVQDFPWWLPLLEGISSLILGLLILSYPGASMAIIIRLLGFYWLIAGVFSLVNIFVKKSNVHWGWLLLKGIVGILAGIVVIRHPILSAIFIPTVLVGIVASFGIFGGVIAIVVGFKEGPNWAAIILGFFSIVFGLTLFSSLLIGASLIPFVVGIAAVAGGILAIIFSFQIRNS